ncbi:mitochondrion biogenesis protein [Myxozyma melibiosi]|uniref:Mitochondrion biogenesis protein n=1 Tax=Myxozyma melibiosi TaxID=54550 RepID=A0ABR1F7E1_9ASCO
MAARQPQHIIRSLCGLTTMRSTATSRPDLLASQPTNLLYLIRHYSRASGTASAHPQLSSSTACCQRLHERNRHVRISQLAFSRTRGSYPLYPSRKGLGPHAFSFSRTFTSYCSRYAEEGGKQMRQQISLANEAKVGKSSESNPMARQGEDVSGSGHSSSSGTDQHDHADSTFKQQTSDHSHETWSSAVSRRLPHRPTKEELLKAASGAFERFKIRFKWVLLRQVRPFNMDDMSAFFSWLILGNVIWVLLGTTTFFSLFILTGNTVFAQETFGRIIGNYLTKETGVTVVFENAIVPRWSDGVISFRNVFISRRPGKNDNRVVKGSRATAAAAAAAAAAAHNGEPAPELEEEVVDDGNYTQFDLTVDSINVTLSFRKWMNGKGILADVEVKGIRGLIDRTHVHWLPGVDPRSYKKVHRPGDFEIEHFVLEDALVTILQPDNFRPFEISIFSCDLPQLRRQWLFYDILGANHMSGSYDDSLFTIHPRQTLTSTGGGLQPDDDRYTWKKTSRLRVDGVSMDHLNRGVTEGAFSWISDGEVDLIADVMIPSEDQDKNFSRVMQDILERWEETLLNREQKRRQDVTRHERDYDIDDDEHEFQNRNWTLRNMIEYAKQQYQINRGQIELEDVISLPVSSSSGSTIGPKQPEKYIVFDLRIQLHNVRAALPLMPPELSYINNALIRPMIAYINNRNTYIPINCRVVKKLSEFDGSWTIFDSGLMDDLSAEVYEAIATNVRDDEERARRMKKVGMWSLHLALQVFLMSIGTIAI